MVLVEMAALRAMVVGLHSAAPLARVSARRCASSHIAAVTAAAAGTDLRQWVKDQGGFVWTGLHVRHSGGPEGMEILAAQDLPRGTTIIALPRRVPMTMPDCLSPRDAVLCELAERVPEELWALRLGLRLLSERAQHGSFWWPYISMLPQTFTLPIFFSGADIENIDYIPVTHQVKKRCKFLLQFASEASHILKMLPEENHPFGGQTVDSGAFGWAMAAVSSRAFRTHNETIKLCSAMMLPLIDMCNHSLHPNARIVEDSSKESQDSSFLKVVTENDLQKGTPITINYGPLSNDMLLLDYGFVIPDNPNDRIELRYDGVLLDNARLIAGLDKPDSSSFSSPAPWQLELLRQLGLCDAGESQKVTLGGPEQVDGRLLAALRVLYAESGDIDITSNDGSALKSWSGMLGIENEQKVLRTLCALAAIVLNHFKTSIMEDETSLANKGLAYSTRMGIEFRLTKKRLLLKVLESLKTKIRDLNSGKIRR